MNIPPVAIGTFEVPLPHPSSRTKFKAFIKIEPKKLQDLVTRAAMKKHRQSKLHYGAITIEVLPEQPNNWPLQ